MRRVKQEGKWSKKEKESSKEQMHILYTHTDANRPLELKQAHTLHQKTYLVAFYYLFKINKHKISHNEIRLITSLKACNRINLKIVPAF